MIAIGKIVKTVLVVVAVVALAVFALPALTSVLYGAFGGAALAGGSAAVMAATTTAALAAKAVAGIIILTAASFASQLIMGKPKTSNYASISRLSVTLDPTATRKIAFGLTAFGQDERYHEKTNKNGSIVPLDSDKGDYFHKVVALASHKVHSVDRVVFDDLDCFNGSVAIGTYANKGGLNISAISEGSSSNALVFGSGTYWNNQATFTGCAYLKLSLKLDSEIYPNGLPAKMVTIGKGCPLYDPRFDSTAGGSGSHRVNDQNTWQWVNGLNEIGRNPALQLLTYIIGYRINGKLAWGMGIPVGRIDLGNFITYANLCDESVVTKGGGTAKRYLSDVLLSTGDTHESNIGILTGAMGTAKLVDTDGIYQLIGGYNDLDGPIFTFTEDDIVHLTSRGLSD